MDAAIHSFGDVPLMQCRVGACGRTAVLARALESEPGLADANFELARAELQRDQADYDEALHRFRLAQEFAETELQAALDRDYGLCEAATYLGGVRAERRRWLESLAAFQHAEQCSELSVAANRQAIAELAATEDGTRTHARRIASLERAIADAERRRAEAMRNAAAIRRQLELDAP